MTIKPESLLNSTKVLSGALSSGGTLHLSGRDAIAFAQAQFANDVALLGDGQWQWSVWLSAKGRVIALFALLRAGPEELIAWLPDFPAVELAERLMRFRFRSKVVIETFGNLHACGVFASPADLKLDAAGHRATVQRDEERRVARIALDMSGHAPRTLLLQSDMGAMASDFSRHSREGGNPVTLTRPCVKALDSRLRGNDGNFSQSPDADARWRLEDIAHGLPRLAGAQVEAFTPQMLGLERLPAFSVKKGCYPGQEIVARTHFLGQVKRTAVRLALNTNAKPGLRLTSPGGAQAELVCLAHLGERIEALAVAPVDTGSEPFRNEDDAIEAMPLPLLAGLERT